MLPGLRLPAVPELGKVCYKSFSLIFGGDGAGGTEEEVLELFCAVGFSSRSWDFSLVLMVPLVFDDDDVVAPLLGVFSVVFSCFSGGWTGGATAFFDCQFTSSIDTNFFRRSRY